jgi:hypothetical protein
MTATVKIDGEWYVSGFYTLADYALKDAGGPLADDVDPAARQPSA